MLQLEAIRSSSFPKWSSKLAAALAACPGATEV